MFDPTKDDLKDILKKVDEGNLQLPDFQRDYVWQDEDVQSLIASIAKGFPVGAILTLETGGENFDFKARPLEGVETENGSPDELLLDGQQRLTSIYQAAYADKPVRTLNQKKKLVHRYYFLDIEKAVDESFDFEEAIVATPGDKIIRKNFGREIELDLSTQEAEFENYMFPLNKTFNSMDWLFKWKNYLNQQSRDTEELDHKLYYKIIDKIGSYKMPIIRLDKNNSREAICMVFEKVNVGGKKLDAFQLVTAIYAAQNYDLRMDWMGDKKNGKPGRKELIIGTPHPRNVLTKLESTDFLQACTILHTRARRLEKAEQGFTGKDLPKVSCTRKALLDLPLESYEEYADSIEEGFREAGSFMNEQKIIWYKDVPYPPLIVVLAATFSICGKQAKSAAAKEKLALWFWSVTFGELYGSSTESRMARDVADLVGWIKGEGQHPRSVDEAFMQQQRLKELRTRISAAYKGVHALLMRQGCRDFITGKSADIMTFFDDKINVHHIFPQDWCKKQGIDSKIYDSIVNKTPLSEASNKSIGGKAPSEYLKKIEEEHGLTPEQLDEILRSHLINPNHLRNDNFDAFFNDRMKALTDMISGAMFNRVVKEEGMNEPEDDPEEVPGVVEDELYQEETV